MASLLRAAILSLRRACSPGSPSTGKEPVSGTPPLRWPASRRSRRVRATAAVAAGLLLGVLARAGRAGDPPVAAPQADLGFYVVHVAPLLDAKCASCHRAAGCCKRAAACRVIRRGARPVPGRAAASSR